MPVNAIPSLKERVKPELTPLKTLPGADAPLPGPWAAKPAPAKPATALPDLNVGTDSVLLNTIAKALLPALGKMIAVLTIDVKDAIIGKQIVVPQA